MVNLHSLAIRQSVLILLGISVIFLSIFLSMRFHVSSRVSELLTARGEEISEKNVSTIDAIFHEAVEISESMVDEFSHRSFAKDSSSRTLVDYLKKTAEKEMPVIAVVVAYEPEPTVKGTKEFMRSATWVNGQVDTLAGWDYTDKAWYKDVKEAGKAMWVEPFVGQFIRVPIAVYASPFYMTNSDGTKRFAGVICVDISIDYLQKKVNAIPINNDGYAFILSKSNTIVAHPEDAWIFKASLKPLTKDRQRRFFKFEDVIRNMQKGLMLGENSEGKSACIYFTPMQVEGWTFGVVWPAEKFFEERRSIETFFGWVSVLGYAVMLLIVVSISLRISKPLKKMERIASELGRGNFDVEIPLVNGKDEVSSFSRAFIHMRDSLVEYIANLKAVTAENERMESELNVARNIQMGLLPKMNEDACILKGTIQVDAFLLPAREVGGDCYDFYELDENHFAFLIADVSGKGIPAAMFLMTFRTLLKSIVMTGIPLNEAFIHANDRLAKKNDQNMFVTVWMGILNLKTSHVDFVSAGHNPPAIRHANGDVEFIKSKTDFVLGGMEGIRYKLQSLELQRGDSLFLYTDGVVEATDCNEALFGEDRLLNALKKEGPMIQNVKMDLDSFVDKAPQFDDITMLSFLYHGESAEEES